MVWCGRSTRTDWKSDCSTCTDAWEKGNMTDERIDPIGSVTPEPTCTECRRRPRWAGSLWCEPCYVRLGIMDGTAAFSDVMARLGGVRIVTWAISRNPLRPGALVTAGDVCHLHPDRAAAERCGVFDGRRPGSGEARETHGAGLPGAVVPFGRGRGRATETGAPAGTATREAPRRRSELAGERPHKRPCGGARRLGAADGGRSMTATLGGC